MEHVAFQDPALTIALAAAAGMLAQTVARHVRVPGIVLLLGTGLLLGPDGIGVVWPGTLGHSLHSLVGFAVAVILFEGGMNLRLDRLRREARSIGNSSRSAPWSRPPAPPWPLGSSWAGAGRSRSFSAPW